MLKRRKRLVFWKRRREGRDLLNRCRENEEQDVEKKNEM